MASSSDCKVYRLRLHRQMEVVVDLLLPPLLLRLGREPVSVQHSLSSLPAAPKTNGCQQYERNNRSNKLTPTSSAK